MAGQCALKFNPFSKSVGDSLDFSIYYQITGLDDVDDAEALLSSTAPTRVGPLYLHHAKVTPTASEEVWDGEAQYSASKPLTQPIFSIEIGTASTRFTNSLMTVGSYAPLGQLIQNYQQAIGVTKDGIEGVDVMVPSFTWNERHFIPDSRVNQGYLLMLYNATARMNDAQFRIFAPGEALFLGCTLNESTELPGWEGNFRWIGSPNAVNFNVGPNITVAAKLGHDYLWIKYKDSISNGSTVKIPQNVFVERVYQFTSMDEFQLDDPT